MSDLSASCVLKNQSWVTGYNCNPTSIIEEESRNSIKVYPNPSEGNVNFKIENVGNILKDIELSIYSSLGQKVSDETISSGENEVNLSYLENGTYFYVLSYDDTPFKNGQLIIQK